MKMLTFSLLFSAAFAVFGVIKTSNTHVAVGELSGAELTSSSSLVPKDSAQGVDVL